MKDGYVYSIIQKRFNLLIKTNLIVEIKKNSKFFKNNLKSTSIFNLLTHHNHESKIV